MAQANGLMKSMVQSPTVAGASCISRWTRAMISQAEPLLGQIDDKIGQFAGDGAFYGDPTYIPVLRHSVQAEIVIPTRSTAMARQDTEPLERFMFWQKRSLRL